MSSQGALTQPSVASPHEGVTADGTALRVASPPEQESRTRPVDSVVRRGDEQRRANKVSRVVLITNIPTPYRIPLFNELNRQLAAENISLKVIFAALGYPRRKWKIDMTECAFAWEVLNSGRLLSRDPESAVFTYSGIGRVLNKEDDALIIVSGFSLASTRVWLRSLFGKTRYLIWSGAIERKDRPDPLLRRWQRRLLVSRVSGCISYGTQAKEYLVSLGADPSRVFIGINTVDTEFFRKTAERIKKALHPANASKELLFVGELSRRKRVDLLLKAVAQLARSRSDIVLRLVGTGSEEANLRAMSRELGIEGMVIFEGLRQKAEIAEFVARADCFLFPTGFDIWGLVLVEAMAAGAVCLSSIRASATRDLILDGVTGFAVDFEDVEEVAGRLAWVLGHPEQSVCIGEAAKSHILREACISKSADGFVKAVRQALIRK